MIDKSELDPKQVRSALESCYMLARMKRVITFNYNDPDNPRRIGPKSDDTDWDHIIRICEEAGLIATIVRTA